MGCEVEGAVLAFDRLTRFLQIKWWWAWCVRPGCLVDQGLGWMEGLKGVIRWGVCWVNLVVRLVCSIIKPKDQFCTLLIFQGP